jgi:hypothetical protein
VAGNNPFYDAFVFYRFREVCKPFHDAFVSYRCKGTVLTTVIWSRRILLGRIINFSPVWQLCLSQQIYRP